MASTEGGVETVSGPGTALKVVEDHGADEDFASGVILSLFGELSIFNGLDTGIELIALLGQRLELCRHRMFLS